MRKFAVSLLILVCGLCVGAAQEKGASASGVTTNLYNFADGVETWAVAPSNAKAGTTGVGFNEAAKSPQSLQIDTTENGWFGPAYSSPQLPIYTSDVTKLLFNITTTAADTSIAIAVQVGNHYQWCQTSWGYIDSAKTTTITVNLPSLLASASACGGTVPADSSEINGIWIYFSRGGTYYLNTVRTQ